MDALAAEVRKAFADNLPLGAALDPRDLADVTYLVRLMRADPIDDEHTRKLHNLEVAATAIEDLARGLIPWAEKELAAAMAEGRNTDLDRFLQTLHTLSEYAAAYMRGIPPNLLKSFKTRPRSNPRRTHPHHRWHGWARMLQPLIRLICSKAGVTASFGKGTGVGTKIMAALLRKEHTAIVSVLRKR